MSLRKATERPPEENKDDLVRLSIDNQRCEATYLLRGYRVC